MNAALPAGYRALAWLSAALVLGLVGIGLVDGWRVAGTPPDIRTGFNAALATLSQRGGVPVEQLEKAVAIAVNERHAHHYNLATALAARGDRARAIDELRAALAVKGDYALAHRDLGMLLLQTGGAPELAAQHLQTAVQLDARDAVAWFGIGNALGRAGRWQAAADAYRGAVERGLALPAVHHNLGTALGKLGDEAGARAAYEAALRLDPTYERSRRALAPPAP
ncbi:MAG: hypothetical protein RIT45_1033 [Pseudomonadota bacterium]